MNRVPDSQWVPHRTGPILWTAATNGLSLYLRRRKNLRVDFRRAIPNLFSSDLHCTFRPSTPVHIPTNSLSNSVILSAERKTLTKNKIGLASWRTRRASYQWWIIVANDQALEAKCICVLIAGIICGRFQRQCDLVSRQNKSILRPVRWPKIELSEWFLVLSAFCIESCLLVEHLRDMPFVFISRRLTVSAIRIYASREARIFANSKTLTVKWTESVNITHIVQQTMRLIQSRNRRMSIANNWHRSFRNRHQQIVFHLGCATLRIEFDGEPLHTWRELNAEKEYNSSVEFFGSSSRLLQLTCNYWSMRAYMDARFQQCNNDCWWWPNHCLVLVD